MPPSWGFVRISDSPDTTQHMPVWHECIHSTYIDGLAGVGTDARGLGTLKLNTSSSDGSRRPQRVCERFVIIDAAPPVGDFLERGEISDGDIVRREPHSI